MYPFGYIIYIIPLLYGFYNEKQKRNPAPALFFAVIRVIFRPEYVIITL